MEDGNGWKIGCSIVLIIINLILGAVFEPIAPVNAIFFLIAAVLFFYVLYKVVSLEPKKSEEQEVTTSVWRNENTNEDTTAALLEQIEVKEENKSEEKKVCVTKDKLEEYLKAEKDERIKPFIENYIKCYDLIFEPFTHHWDHDHPDSEESKLYDEEYKAH